MNLYQVCKRRTVLLHSTWLRCKFCGPTEMCTCRISAPDLGDRPHRDCWLAMHHQRESMSTWVVAYHVGWQCQGILRNAFLTPQRLHDEDGTFETVVLIARRIQGR